MHWKALSVAVLAVQTTARLEGKIAGREAQVIFTQAGAMSLQVPSGWQRRSDSLSSAMVNPSLHVYVQTSSVPSWVSGAVHVRTEFASAEGGDAQEFLLQVAIAHEGDLCHDDE